VRMPQLHSQQTEMRPFGGGRFSNIWVLPSGHQAGLVIPLYSTGIQFVIKLAVLYCNDKAVLLRLSTVNTGHSR
jgi:hypothetical protein